MSPGNRLKLWNMKLTVWRLRANSSEREAAVTSRPPTETLPAVGVSSAPMMFSSVVFPLPEGPSTTTNSPSDTCSSTSSSARTTTGPIW